MKQCIPIFFAAIALVALAAGTAQAITIDLVTVDNAGNAPDTRYNSISVESLRFSVFQTEKFASGRLLSY